MPKTAWNMFHNNFPWNFQWERLTQNYRNIMFWIQSCFCGNIKYIYALWHINRSKIYCCNTLAQIIITNSASSLHWIASSYTTNKLISRHKSLFCTWEWKSFGFKCSSSFYLVIIHFYPVAQNLLIDYWIFIYLLFSFFFCT